MQFILFNFVKLLTLDYVLSPIYNYHHIYSGDESLRVVLATSVFVNIDLNNIHPLFITNQRMDDEEILREVWAEYYYELGNPTYD